MLHCHAVTQCVTMRHNALSQGEGGGVQYVSTGSIVIPLLSQCVTCMCHVRVTCVSRSGPGGDKDEDEEHTGITDDEGDEEEEEDYECMSRMTLKARNEALMDVSSELVPTCWGYLSRGPRWSLSSGAYI